jgi:hypothetical protein
MSAADTERLEQIVIAALEEGGINGLCLEGRIDLAIDRLRREHPEVDAVLASALVRAVLDRQETGRK